MGNEKETGRIEAFSDGVLGIVMTLLVLELKVPEPRDTPDFSLISELLSHWPTYLAFVVSFSFVLVMWINHHRMFSIIQRSDDILLAANGLLLFGITLFPFAMGIAATYLQHAQAVLGVTIFNGLSVINSVFFNILWRYASGNNRMFKSDVDQALVKTITRQYAMGPLLYAAVLVVGWFSPLLSLFLQAGMALFFALPNKLFTQLEAEMDKAGD